MVTDERPAEKTENFVLQRYGWSRNFPEESGSHAGATAPVAWAVEGPCELGLANSGMPEKEVIQ